MRVSVDTTSKVTCEVRQLHALQALPAAQPACSLDDSWISSDPNSYMRQLCTPGYYGPVCSLCITTGNVTYGRVGTLECKPCRRTITIIAAYVASALLVLAWLTYTVHITLMENEEAASGHDNPQRTSQLIRVSLCLCAYFGHLHHLVRCKVCNNVRSSKKVCGHSNCIAHPA